MFEKIKKKFEEDPITTTIVASIALGAIAKFIGAVSEAEGRHAYSRQVRLAEKRARRG